VQHSSDALQCLQCQHVAATGLVLLGELLHTHGYALQCGHQNHLHTRLYATVWTSESSTHTVIHYSVDIKIIYTHGYVLKCGHQDHLHTRLYAKMWTSKSSTHTVIRYSVDIKIIYTHSYTL
jgi:hypothetical protein